MTNSKLSQIRHGLIELFTGTAGVSPALARNSLAKVLPLVGKAKPFRTEGGKAARLRACCGSVG